MKAKLPSLTFIALVAAASATGAWAAHDDSTSADVGGGPSKRWAQTDAADVDWIADLNKASPAKPRGAEGPVREEGPSKPQSQSDVADIGWWETSPTGATKPGGNE